MRISDLLDVLGDDTVPVTEREDADLSERIADLTLQKVRGAEAEAEKGKRGRSRGGVVLALIAAALAALSVTAYASGLLGRLVDWRGQTVETPVDPLATVPPDAALYGDEARDALIAGLLAQREGRELVIVRDGGSVFCSGRTVPVTSPEALEAMLAGENSPLTVPLTVPAGYALTSGGVSYESARGYGYTLESLETREDGLVVERYSAPPEGDFISGYWLEWENDAGERLFLTGNMWPGAAAMDFGVPEGSDVFPLTVTGMDDALGVQDEGYATLTLRRGLASPVPFAPSDPLEEGGRGFLFEYTDILYQIHAAGLTVAQLLAMT